MIRSSTNHCYKIKYRLHAVQMVKAEVSLKVYGLKEDKKWFLFSITSWKKVKSLKITDNTVYTRRSHPHISEEKLDGFYFFCDFSSFRLEIKCCLYQIIISHFWLRHSNDPRKIIFNYYFAPCNNKLLLWLLKMISTHGGLLPKLLFRIKTLNY